MKLDKANIVAASLAFPDNRWKIADRQCLRCGGNDAYLDMQELGDAWCLEYAINTTGRWRNNWMPEFVRYMEIVGIKFEGGRK